MWLIIHVQLSTMDAVPNIFRILVIVYVKLNWGYSIPSFHDKISKSLRPPEVPLLYISSNND